MSSVRQYGGRFLQADDKRGGAHFEIGDKPAWAKTSQALREGQKEIREKLAKENGGIHLDEYKQVISEQTFFAYSCRMLESLYKQNEHGEVTACGPNCLIAKRRKELQGLGVEPWRVHQAMQAVSMSPTAIAPPPLMQQNNFANPSQPMPPTVNYQSPPYDQSNGVFPHSSTDLAGSSVPSTAFQSMGDQNVQVDGAGLDSLEPLNYKLDHGLPKPSLIKKFISTGSVFSLRNVCSEDFEMSSEEGKALMEQLNMEVDELLQRKSVGLIEIDSKYAFEDLLFDEDSVDFDAENDFEMPKRELSEDLSLMNMSILSISDDAKSPSSSIKSSLKSKPSFPIRKSYLENELNNGRQEQRKSSVSFAHSVMSLDNESFRNLITYLQEPESMSDLEREPEQSNARKMGFPIKKSVVDEYQNGMPTVVGQKSVNEPGEKLSNLTIEEERIGTDENSFSHLVGEVAKNNSSVPLSGRSLMMSKTGVSDMNMSISSDIGEGFHSRSND